MTSLRPLAPPVRRAATVLWVVGAGLAGTTGVVSVVHAQIGFASIYFVVSAVLLTLAFTTSRGNTL